MNQNRTMVMVGDIDFKMAVKHGVIMTRGCRENTKLRIQKLLKGFKINRVFKRSCANIFSNINILSECQIVKIIIFDKFCNFKNLFWNIFAEFLERNQLIETHKLFILFKIAQNFQINKVLTFLFCILAFFQDQNLFRHKTFYSPIQSKWKGFISMQPLRRLLVYLWSLQFVPSIPFFDWRKRH